MCWDDVGERKLLGPEMLQIVEEKTAQNRPKSYPDKHRLDPEC